MKILTARAAILVAFSGSLYADTFGSGPNAFTIDFSVIGNAGNLDDSGVGGGLYSSPYGGVSYNYRIGVTEAKQDWIAKATALGLSNVAAGPWNADQPATNMTWFEAAAFVNWLNTTTGHQRAYNLNAGATAVTLWSPPEAWQIDGENLYRHKDAYYFLPNEDEWYKAAFHKNDGVTANYWDYATGSNAIPDGIDFAGDTTFDAVFLDGANQGQPNSVTNVGLASPYGTLGQNGNALEMLESAMDGINDSSSKNRVFRGGTWSYDEPALRSSFRAPIAPSDEAVILGFRVASVPEPSSLALVLGGTAISTLFHRRRRTAN